MKLILSLSTALQVLAITPAFARFHLTGVIHGDSVISSQAFDTLNNDGKNVCCDAKWGWWKDDLWFGVTCLHGWGYAFRNDGSTAIYTSPWGRRTVNVGPDFSEGVFSFDGWHG